MNAQVQPLAIPANIQQSITKVVAGALEYVEIVENFVINNAEDAELAGKQLTALSKFQKDHDEERLEYTRPYTALASSIKAAYDEPLSKAKTAETALKRALGVWTDAENERIEKLRKAEEDRIALERRQAQDKLDAEEKRLGSLKSAPAIERAQERVEAAVAAVEEIAVTAPVRYVAPKIGGFTQRDNYVPQIASNALTQIIEAIAAGRTDLLQFVMLNEPELKKVAKVLKLNLKVPGVTVVNEKIGVAGRR